MIEKKNPKQENENVNVVTKSVGSIKWMYMREVKSFLVCCMWEL